MVQPCSLAGIVFLGIYPKPFFDRVNPSCRIPPGTRPAGRALNAGVPSQGSSAIKYTVLRLIRTWTSPASTTVGSSSGSSSSSSPQASGAGQVIGLLQGALLGVPGQSSPTTTLGAMQRRQGRQQGHRRLHRRSTPASYPDRLPQHPPDPRPRRRGLVASGCVGRHPEAVQARLLPAPHSDHRRAGAGCFDLAVERHWRPRGPQITIGTQVYYDRFSAFFMVLFSVAT